MGFFTNVVYIESNKNFGDNKNVKNVVQPTCDILKWISTLMNTSLNTNAEKPPIM